MRCSRSGILCVAAAVVSLSSAAAAEDDTGMVIITVSVPGASVMLDGELRGESPLDPLSGVPAGIHKVEVQAAGHRTFNTEFTLEAGKTKEISAFLNALKGARVTVDSITEGARVYIDDFDVGTVPLAEPLIVAPGSHEIKVTRLGFMAYSETADLTMGQKKHVQADLLAFAGILDVRSTVPKAEVLIDDKPVGITPAEIEVFAGKHTIVVRKEGHVSHEEQLTIAAGVSYSVQAELVPIHTAEPEPEVGTDEGDTETLVASEERTTLVAPPPAQPGAEPQEEGKAWYKQWWLWTAVAVVVGVAIAVPVAVDATSGGSTSTRLPETDVPDIQLP